MPQRARSVVSPQLVGPRRAIYRPLPVFFWGMFFAVAAATHFAFQLYYRIFGTISRFLSYGQPFFTEGQGTRKEQGYVYSSSEVR